MDDCRNITPIFAAPPATVQSQYAASPKIVALAQSFERVLPSDDIRLFFKEILNIYSARGGGLDIWGRILGVGRLIEVQNEEHFGFYGSLLLPFDQAPFFFKGLSSSYVMEDDAYRKYLLLVKAFANISSCDAATINYILSQLVPGKAAYVLVVGVMQIRFVFEFLLAPVERAVMNLGLIVRGAAVGYEYLEVPVESTFGFAGSGLQSFDQGTFSLYEIVIQGENE